MEVVPHYGQKRADSETTLDPTEITIADAVQL